MDAWTNVKQTASMCSNALRPFKLHEGCYCPLRMFLRLASRDSVVESALFSLKGKSSKPSLADDSL